MVLILNSICPISLLLKRRAGARILKHIFEDFMKKVGTSMNTTVNHYNNAYKELAKIDKDVVKITEGEKVIEPILVDRPKLED